MKNLFTPATLAAVFIAFTITGLQAADGVQGKSTPVTRSNISNNKAVSDPKDDDCDGRTDAPDCVKAKKDYATDPYVEGSAVSRDAASGQATGKRQQKPMSVSEAKPMAPREAAGGSLSASDDKTAQSSNGEPAPELNARSDPFKGTNVAKVKQMQDSIKAAQK